MRNAFECSVALGEQKFAAPDCPIQSVAGSIPHHTESRRSDLILCYAGCDVGPVMLDLDFGRARHAACSPWRVRAVYGGQRTARPTGEIVTVFGREIIRMHIAR